MEFFIGIPLWVFIISVGKLKAQVTPISPIINQQFLPKKSAMWLNHDKDCSYWKDFNYKTFDGEIFYFPGTCNYIFSSHCKSIYEDFIIQIKHFVVNRTVVNTKIAMKIDGTLIDLIEDTVVVNNALVNLPYSEHSVIIFKIEEDIRINSGIGLSFTKRGNDGFLLQLAEKYANTTCGLCGDFNGKPYENEFMSDGIEISELEFGKSQKSVVLNDECEDEELTIPSSCSDSASLTCVNAFSSPHFEFCNILLDPDYYINACIVTLCVCEEERYNSCICPTLSEYSYQCIHNGGVPKNWRTQELCPKTCPLNMEYQECDFPCFNSCTNPERQLICDDYCMAGCFCPQGLIFDDITNVGCIPIEECSCTYNGNIYKPGQSYMSSCRSCNCSGGQWLCKEIPCSATCAVEGGCHITSFDETHFDVHGDCNYVLMKLCNESTIIVLGELRPCGRQESQSCLTSVTIIVDDDQTIEIKTSGDIYLNWMFTTLPVITDTFTLFRPSPFYIIFNADIGIHIVIQIEMVMDVYIVLDPSFKSRTCGLCGNYNDQQNDDFQTISGVTEGNAAAFADTWKTAADCPNAKTIYDDPCSLSIETEQYAKYWCGLIRATDDIFSPCHKVVDPTIYYKNCLVDTCNCENSEACMCAALSAYNRICVAKGVVLKDWQIKGCAKYIMECPKNLVFTFGITTCLPTCRSLSEPDKTCNVHFDPLPGCSCSKGTYIDPSGRCVPETDCPCYYRGIAIFSKEIINDNGVTCNCTKGKLFCTSARSIDCIAPMIYVDCDDKIRGSKGVECFKSCRTLDMQCYKSRCIPGCVCPPGLVSNDKGGCIDQMQCPCIHNGIMYEPGEQIRIQCNTCTCKNRMWKCTKKACLSTCTVYGDGHYITFDGKSYNFNGDCEYTLVQDHCSLNESINTFSVITENVQCGTTGVTCSKSIKVFLEGYELILSDNHLNVVQRGTETEAPYQVRLMGIYLVMEAKNGLLLFWDMKTSIFIKVPSQYKQIGVCDSAGIGWAGTTNIKVWAVRLNDTLDNANAAAGIGPNPGAHLKRVLGQLCGLCGNYDGNGNNDFTTRGHAVVGNVEEFGNSWKLSSLCPDAHLHAYPCAFNPYRLSWAQKQCSIITSNVFSVCHPHVDPSNFYDACVSDSCACNTGGDCECFCTAVAAYAQACGESGICVSWRDPNRCPLFCDYYNELGECEWHYKPCGAPCMKTCRNPSGKCTYEVRGLEGCYPSCPKERPLFDEDEMKCVSKCGCYDEDRIHYKVGAKVPSRKNCYVCTCTADGIKCTYVLKECKCEYEKYMYKFNATIYNTTDGFGNCVVAICKENGTIHRNVYPCATSATPPFTFTTVSSRAPTVVTTMTSTVCEVQECLWSDWFDFDSPDIGQDGGDLETYENIRNQGGLICEKPIEIECGHKFSADLIIPLNGLSEQNIECNVTFGLICYNKYQNTKRPFCFNYAIRVLCCSFVPCPPSTRTSPTTTPEIKTSFSSVTSHKPSTACQPTCRWTPWFSENKPSFTLDGGDTESYEELIRKGKNICTHPEAIECRPKGYENMNTIPEELKQNVICDLITGLLCKNRNQILNLRICFDYEIRFKCCDNYSHCLTTSAHTTSKITYSPRSSTIIKSTVKSLSTGSQPRMTTPKTPPTTTKEKSTSSKLISTTKISTTTTRRPTTTKVSVTSSKAQTTPTKRTTTKISSPTTSKETVTIIKSTVKSLSTGTQPRMTTPKTPPTTTKEKSTSSKLISTTKISTTTTRRPTTTKVSVTSSKAQTTPTKRTTTKISSPTTSKETVTIIKSTVKSLSTGTQPRMTTPKTPPTTTKEKSTSSKLISTTKISTTTTRRPTTTKVSVTSSKAQTTPTKRTTTKISSPTTSKETVTIIKSTVKSLSTGTQPRMTTPKTPPTTTKEKSTSSKLISTTKISTTTTRRPTTTKVSVTSSKAQTTPTKRTTTKISSPTTSKETVTIIKSTVKSLSTGTQPRMTTPKTPPTTTKEKSTSSKLISTTKISTTTTRRPTTTKVSVTSSKAQTTPTKRTTTKISSPTTSKETVTIIKSTVKSLSTGTQPRMTTPKTPPTTTKEKSTSSKLISTTKISTTTTRRPTTTKVSVTSSKAQTTPTKRTTTKISSPTTSKETVTIIKSTVKSLSTGTQPRMTTPKTPPKTSKETVTTRISTTSVITPSQARTTPTQFRTSTRATSVPITTKTTTTTRLVTSPRSTTPSTTLCRCNVGGVTFSPGDIIYRTTDASGCSFYSICNQYCRVEMKNGPCRPTSTFQPTSTATVQSTETTIEGCSSRKVGESWHTDNCTISTCIGNNVINVSVVQCKTPPILDCSNGFVPNRILDDDGCCYKYECPCNCGGIEDSIFITFDGRQFKNEDLCTQILVEQINKIYDDFKVLLENTICNKTNKMNCPQTLWIYYNGNKIGLKRSMNANQRIIKEITFNNKTVDSGFHKDGIDVFYSGIAMLVDIPAIDAHIIYSGVAFVIQLPYSKFGNNTEGLCGTCNNDPSDDCRFPVTRNISDCSETAPHWNTNKTANPECTPLVTTAAATECPPSTICNVINSALFAPCHRIIRQDYYYLNCLSNCQDECNILELYSSQCFMQGICIDWRMSVGSQCSIECPPDQVYKPCDTILQPTCEMRNLSIFKPHMVESCRCPPGSLFFNSSRDHCVSTCNCVTSNGTEKSPGDVWESDCQNCSCDHSMIVQCKPIVCPEPEIPTCDKIGQVVIEVFNSNSTCCPTYVCRCNVSHCPTDIPECEPGYYLVSHLENGECCFKYECKPMNVCVTNDTKEVLQPGDTYVNKTNPCETCVCSEEMDDKTGLKLLLCDMTVCNTTCPQDFEYKVKSGQCCGECTLAGCNVTLQNGQSHIIKARTETWFDPANKCIYYRCIQDNGHYILINLTIDCDIKNASYCKPGYEYQVKKDECCGVCVQVACIQLIMDNTSKIMQPGETWKNPDKPCEFFECVLINNNPTVVSKPKSCPSSLCHPGFIENPDKCCGDHCIPESCVLNLENNVTQFLKPGESWSPPDNECISYTCDLMFALVATKIHCPPFDLSQCKEGTLGIGEDGCCPTCVLKKAKPECFQRKEKGYLIYLDCTSQELVELPYCDGICSSSSIYSVTSKKMEHICDCCKPSEVTTKEVTLECNDGRNIQYSYIYVEKCDCTASLCVDFNTIS